MSPAITRAAGEKYTFSLTDSVKTRTTFAVLTGAEPINMAGSGEERYEKVRFAVVNVNEHQKELKKAYKVQEDGDIFDRPSCIMYARGSYENPGYAVYLEHDRIGDADENKCREIYDLLGQGELTDISYTINAEFDDDINDLYYTCIVTMTAKMP